MLLFMTWEKPFLTEAPYLVLVLSNVKAPFSKESAWLSIGYLLLALEEEGLATVTYMPPNFKAIAKLVNAPKDCRLEVILPVDYSNDDKPKYGRKRLEEVYSLDKFELKS